MRQSPRNRSEGNLTQSCGSRVQSVLDGVSRMDAEGSRWTDILEPPKNATLRQAGK